MISLVRKWISLPLVSPSEFHLYTTFCIFLEICKWHLNLPFEQKKITPLLSNDFQRFPDWKLATFLRFSFHQSLFPFTFSALHGHASLSPMIPVLLHRIIGRATVVEAKDKGREFLESRFLNGIRKRFKEKFPFIGFSSTGVTIPSTLLTVRWRGVADSGACSSVFVPCPVFAPVVAAQSSSSALGTGPRNPYWSVRPRTQHSLLVNRHSYIFALVYFAKDTLR